MKRAAANPNQEVEGAILEDPSLRGGSSKLGYMIGSDLDLNGPPEPECNADKYLYLIRYPVQFAYLLRGAIESGELEQARRFAAATLRMLGPVSMQFVLGVADLLDPIKKERGRPAKKTIPGWLIIGRGYEFMKHKGIGPRAERIKRLEKMHKLSDRTIEEALAHVNRMAKAAPPSFTWEDGTQAYVDRTELRPTTAAYFAALSEMRSEVLPDYKSGPGFENYARK